MDLSIIIVNFNTSHYLQGCLSSICRSELGSLQCEVIVVDNASTDDSVAMTRERYPRVLVIENAENVGFSRANNQGIAGASGRYLLFLNQDTVVQADTLARMVAFMDSHGDAGAATCFVKLPDGTLDDAAHRGFPTPWNALCHFSGLSRLLSHSPLFTGYALSSRDLTVTHEIDALAGAFMLVRREAGDVVDWWDEDYFFYGEDLDFCYKLKRAGWKIAFVPDVSILHYKGMSSGIKKISKKTSHADLATRARATYARFDAMKIFYRKHYAGVYPAPVRWLVFAGIAAKQWFALLQLRLSR